MTLSHVLHTLKCILLNFGMLEPQFHVPSILHTFFLSEVQALHEIVTCEQCSDSDGFDCTVIATRYLKSSRLSSGREPILPVCIG